MTVKASDYEQPGIIEMAIHGAQRLTAPGWTPTVMFFGWVGVYTASACPDHAPTEVAHLASVDLLAPVSGPWTH